MALVQSVEIPQALVDAYKEKTKDGKAISTGLFTPESTPEPPQLPSKKNNAKTRAERISALIKSIEDSDTDFGILGVRTTEAFQSRVPALKEVLNKETSEEAKKALQKVEQAEISLSKTVASSKNAINRALKNPDMGLVDLLEATSDEDREVKVASWKWLLSPEWNKEPEAEKAMQILLDAIKEYEGGEEDDLMEDGSDDGDENQPLPEAKRPVSSSFLSELMGSRSVSTKIGVSVSPGSTLDGGKILRYNEYFAQKPKDDGNGEEAKKEKRPPRYNFLVWNDGEYSMKTGKEVGQSAIDGYFKDGKESKLKIGEYYGQRRHGITYSRKYFSDLLELTKKTGVDNLLFLGAVRKAPRTPTGRTMPPEHCVIGIRDPNINAEWYEVFTRSAWTKFYGDEAGHRFDDYWKERGQKPSFRVALKDDDTSTLQSSNVENAALRKEIDQIRQEVKEIKSMKDDMETRIMAEMQKMTANIMTQMNEMMTRMSAMVNKEE
ncbi:hypothetical protein TSTA_060040 [Talaromyces stipitatus ATCC 10500]|uniref:Uncharacterized protein n=1 Tax=Talaromyces stipitatus (strain ATCC 10500 / CBS 375.48 / QM 6759 / NRRL 1006) TaxID=441959 RepID=B8LU34_TALSN|nr:uncharacterized protein TSTA_060040 [Talaromyces stipitatus ATCC 10500]EED22506.1 hypothetical protein TSTA_060040 [Talaromyces stipitatus ATCC 10500]